MPPLPLPASPDRSPDKLGIKALVPKIAAKSIKWHRMSYVKNTEISIISVKWSLFVPLLLSACKNFQKVLVATCSTAIYGIFEIYVRLCTSLFVLFCFVFSFFLLLVPGKQTQVYKRVLELGLEPGKAVDNAVLEGKVYRHLDAVRYRLSLLQTLVCSTSHPITQQQVRVSRSINRSR